MKARPICNWKFVIGNLKASEIFMRRRGFRSAKLQNTNYQSQIPQRGYMMITLMLALAMIAIALLTVLPEIGQQIRRDREEEMRRRGTEYMRAIQHYYRKYNRYPTSIEQLEDTNHLRFLRKRYTDPMNRDPKTGKERDFKILHQTDVMLNNGPLLGQAPGLTGNPLQGGPQGGPRGPQGGLNALQGLAALGAQTGGLQSAVTPNPATGDASNAEGNSDSAESSPSNSIAKSGSTSGFNGPVLGGGPIVGVASMSKEKPIRVFYGKSRYKDWLFIYLPQADQGGLLKGPVNPGMPTPNLNGGNLNPAANTSGFGASANPSQGLSNPAPQSPAQTPPQQ
jgi:type II secretory pathway pseudopilin PulG